MKILHVYETQDELERAVTEAKKDGAKRPKCYAVNGAFVMANSRAKALYLALEAGVKGIECRELKAPPSLPEVLASLPRMTDADRATLLKALGKK